MHEVVKGRPKVNWFRINKLLELLEKRGKERKEHRNRKEVLVEEDFMPMSAVLGVSEFGIKSHNCRE